MEQKSIEEVCEEIGLPSQVLHVKYSENARSMVDYTERVNYDHYSFISANCQKKYLAAFRTSTFNGTQFNFHLFSIPLSIFPVIHDSVNHPQSKERCSWDKMSSPEMLAEEFGVPFENLTHLGSYTGNSRNKYNGGILKLLLLIHTQRIQSACYKFGEEKFILEKT